MLNSSYCKSRLIPPRCSLSASAMAAKCDRLGQLQLGGSFPTLCIGWGSGHLARPCNTLCRAMAFGELVSIPYLTGGPALSFFTRYGSVWPGYESNGTSSRKVGHHQGHQDPSQQQQQEETSKDTSAQENEKEASSGIGDPEMDPSELAMLGIDPNDFAGFGN